MRCNGDVMLDLMDDDTFYSTFTSIPSDVHHLVVTKDGFKSLDEERFSAEELQELIRRKEYHAFRYSPSCEKLQREGYTSLEEGIKNKV